jgi:zinc protease
MKMKKIFAFMLLLMVAMVASAQMQMPSLPIDKDVRIGKLPNGLTYYIRYNNWPEHRAEFYIAQKVGSIQEDENQRGLAHFLEHMCFNGTDNFKGNDLIRYCESIGVKFGRDLNAYTSIDQTVYNISNVPTTRQSALDSCLLILHDWADGLTLAPQEIDKERGVIHEEWRLRTSASSRMFERNMPALYPGSKYGVRYPIGLMSVIDNFKPKALRDYYEKWYYPANQGIIVVGDVDVNHVEAKIKELFGAIKTPATAGKITDEQVPDNAEPIVIIDKDKEQQYNNVDVFFKTDATPDSMKTSPMYLMQQYMINAAVSMLNNRIDEASKKPDCSFLQAASEYGNYIFSKTKDAFDLSVLPKDGKTEAALTEVIKLARQASEFGFTPTEYARHKADYLSGLEKIYSNKDKRYNSQFCGEYKEHFLANEPIMSLDDEYAMMKQVVPMIPLDAINSVMKAMVLKNDTNNVVISFNTEKDGATYPTKDGLLKALHDGKTAKVEAYVDNVKNEPLIAKMPVKGSIKKTTEGKKFGYKELLLSNGAKVILKKTDFKKDQVILNAEGQGGSSLYGAADFANINMFDDVIEASGLGNFNHTELGKALAGKIAGASASLRSRRVMISGQSTPTDVETMLQLVYLYFTKINKDQESFDNVMKNAENELKNKSLNPEQAFFDSINVVADSHNPRFAPMKTADLKNVNYDRILAMAKEQLSNAGAFTFTFLGNFDEEKLLPLIETYIASLPSQKKVVKGHDVSTDYKNNVVCDFKRKMETPKSIAYMMWKTNQLPYTPESSIQADIVGQILSMIYLDKIREQASAAYTVQAMGQAGRLDEKSSVSVVAYCPMKPEKADTALAIMRNEVPALAKHCDAEMLNKVKKFMLKRNDDAQKTNSYWSNVIDDWRDYGLDFDTDFKKTVEAQTPESIQNFVAKLLKISKSMEVVMLPEVSK